jgi:hypothetical protein
MVTLRIWTSSRANKYGPGSSSLLIDGVWGNTYLSTRIVKREAGSVHGSGNANFAEDLKAEGGDTDEIWIFQRLDERRMLSLWGSLRGNASANVQKKPEEISFRTSDMVLTAGRGHDVEPNSAAPFARRAKGALLLAGVASSGSALRARAEHYLKNEHW